MPCEIPKLFNRPSVRGAALGVLLYMACWVVYVLFWCLVTDLVFFDRYTWLALAQFGSGIANVPCFVGAVLICATSKNVALNPDCARARLRHAFAKAWLVAAFLLWIVWVVSSAS